jgi:DivIVA domain-containing protein
MRRGESPPDPPVRITDEDVRKVVFRKPRFGKRGYDEDEVDAFLDVLAEALSTRPGAPRLSPADVHDVAFRKPPLGRRGYDEDEVDAFLDLAEKELLRRTRGEPPPPPAPPPRPASRALPPPAAAPRPPEHPGPPRPPEPQAPPVPTGPQRALDPAAVVHAIWFRMEARDWRGVAELIDPAFVCEWPESRERFMGRDAWISLNVNYPSNWHITVDDVIAQGDSVASRVRVSDENGVFHASSFWLLRDGRAVRLVEYYVREGSAVPPQWRAQLSQRY